MASQLTVRIKQGDCLTDYRAQGIKGVEVRGIEDNRSAVAMANMEAFHVKGTRHVQNVVVHVENKALYLEAIQRSNVKFSALYLERLHASPPRPEPLEPPSVDKGRLLLTAREWGKEFVAASTSRKRRNRFASIFPASPRRRVAAYRHHYNHSRPHGKLGDQSPVRFAATIDPSSPPVGLRPPCVDDGQIHNPKLN